MGRATRRHRRTRPSFFCRSRPARSSTRRCLEMAGSETLNGSANPITDEGPRASRARIPRRVGSDRAEKVASSAASLYLTMWLSIAAPLPLSSRNFRPAFDALNRRQLAPRLPVILRPHGRRIPAWRKQVPRRLQLACCKQAPRNDRAGSRFLVGFALPADRSSAAVAFAVSDPNRAE